LYEIERKINNVMKGFPIQQASENFGGSNKVLDFE
jgi:hypothetical protein